MHGFVHASPRDEEIDGGLVGLIIDARGRPLPFPANDNERQARLLQWMQVMGA
jgi:hypothetical protein